MKARLVHFDPQHGGRRSHHTIIKAQMMPAKAMTAPLCAKRQKQACAIGFIGKKLRAAMVINLA